MNKLYSIILLGGCTLATHADYTTPGNGTVYTFAQLSEITGSGVTRNSDNSFLISSDLTVAAADGLKIVTGDHILVAPQVGVTVEGTAEFNPSGTAVIAPQLTENIDDSSTLTKGWTLSGKSTLSNLQISGGGIKYLGSDPLIVDNCTFTDINDQANGYGVICLSGSSTGSKITNCTFRDCYPGAINTPANMGVELLIENNIIENVSTCNQLRPYINIAACADREIVIRNNTLRGARLEKPGGIGVSNMLNTPGANKVTVEGNYVENCSWGLNFVGGMDVRIINNIIKNNNSDPDVNGGIAATLYSIPSLPQTVYAEGNTFEGNKWGPIVMGGTVANFGKTENIGETDYNPGKNKFINNSHLDGNNNEVKCDFCNTTATTVYAQGNYWNNFTTAEQIATVVQDKNFLPSYGEVIYVPFSILSGIDETAIENGITISGTSLVCASAADMAVFTAGGTKILSAEGVDALDLSSLDNGIYIAVVKVNGKQTSVKFKK